eukprot:scaffold82624_cov59-Phaeocystis_antarctica.AAC.2
MAEPPSCVGCQPSATSEAPPESFDEDKITAPVRLECTRLRLTSVIALDARFVCTSQRVRDRTCCCKPLPMSHGRKPKFTSRKS